MLVLAPTRMFPRFLGDEWDVWFEGLEIRQARFVVRGCVGVRRVKYLARFRREVAKVHPPSLLPPPPDSYTAAAAASSAAAASGRRR